jgi:hypothetical protein
MIGLMSQVPVNALWKRDWEQARSAYTAWWRGDGLALWITAPADEPWDSISAPPPPVSLEQQWLDPAWRTWARSYELSRTFFGGIAYPILSVNIGPGSMGMFLGGEGELAPHTVWYPPVIHDPDTHPPLRFDPESAWYRRHRAVMDHAIAQSRGRWLVGCWDLIENLDTLAQLRGPQEMLIDLLERPAWVSEMIGQINQAYFACYESIEPIIRDPWGGTTFNAFQMWGLGRTIKTQCDFSCMISPDMFRRFVIPCLAEQCAWADNAVYHLDGTQAVQHLDALLAIESLDAIEWTPQAGIPRGGDPMWYDLYRRIKAGGKSVQAIEVAHDQVLPLLDAVGPEGMYVQATAPTERQARQLLRRIGWGGEC